MFYLDVPSKIAENLAIVFSGKGALIGVRSERTLKMEAICFHYP